MDTNQSRKAHPASESTSELKLLRRAQHGEEAAFFELYELHKARVYTTCLRITARPEEAENLTRAAFLDAFRKIAAFRTDGEFAISLQQLATRRAIARRREQAGAPRLPARHEGNGQPRRRHCYATGP